MKEKCDVSIVVGGLCHDRDRDCIRTFIWDA